MARKPKMTIKLICPNGHETVKDEEKSNENWIVYQNPCPECKQDLLVRPVLQE